jgi:hypothetical protein
MAKSEGSLDKQLEKLIKVVEKQDRHERAARKLEESSRALKWQSVARAYVWWRNADQQQGYLDALYAAKGIANNNLSNRINFNPLVRLIWDIHGERWAHVSSLAKTIAALHEEFVENPHLYKRNAEDELVAYIEDNGGLKGVKLKGSLQFDDDDGVIDEPKKKTKSSVKNIEKAVQKELLKRQTDHIAAAKGVAKIDVGDVAVNTENRTGSDLLVLLAKRDDSGKLVVLGTSNDTDLVERAVLECVEFDQSKLTPMLRLLVECLRPHIVPKALHKRGVRDKFFTTHKVSIKEGAKKQDVAESVRLVLTKDGRVLVSKRISKASLLTISQPKEMTISLDSTMFLRGADRYWLETDLINNGLIALYTSEPTDALSDVTKPLLASKRLTLKNDFTNASRDAYFYDYDNLDEAIQRQPTIKNLDEISFDWELSANKTFIDHLCAKHFDAWIEGVGTRISLSHNKALQFAVADDHLEVRSYYQPIEGFTRFGDNAASSYGKDAKLTRLNNLSNEITVSPLDVIELFATLRTLTLLGNVQIKGNSTLMSISYETATAKHTAFVPSCDVKGKRIADHFTKFDADA